MLGYISISRRELFNVWSSERQLSEKNTAVLHFVLEKFNIDDEDSIKNEHLQDIKAILKTFTSRVQTKWTNHSRVLKRFLANENDWLEAGIQFPDIREALNKPDSKIGRPKKDFEDLSVWNKRRRVAPLLENASVAELTFAASSSLYISGKKDAANVVRNISEPGTVEAVKTVMKTPSAEPKKYTPEEALSLFIDGRFTKHTYSLMVSGAKSRGFNIYPPYKEITKAKQYCYPCQDKIILSETSAEVTLQGLVDHTAERLVMSLENTITNIADSANMDLNLTFKWGCDGSSGHSKYKQRFNSDEETDSFLFLVSVVPLRLKQKHDDAIVWHNPRPCSTRLCRPLKIIFKQESKELISKEVKHVTDQITNLSPTTININGKVISISYDFHLTMIDGKSFGAITDTSTQSCGICGSKPSEMNNVEKVKTRKVDVTRYEYGISTLHAHIRCLECLLHVSYRLEVKKWQIRDTEEKEICKEKKKSIQDQLRIQMGLLVDIPKPGYGTTNDGNTARRFFSQYDLASAITGIDANLIKRFGVLLKVVSGSYDVDSKAYEVYAMDTAKLFVKLYPWYNMPSSIHRILIHGADIIEAATLPIGIFSEEALESRNKDLRRFREHNTRKKSRVCQMTDLLHALLFSSDPLISSISFKQVPSPKHKKSIFDEEVKRLLKMESTESSDESDDE